MVTNILFFFAALGLFNALVLSLYLLFFKKQRTAFEYLTGILLFLLFIRVGVSCFYYFGPIPLPLIKIGLLANVLLGPSLLLITQLDAKATDIDRRAHFIHFGGLLILGTFLWIVFDFQVWNHIIRFFFHAILTLYFVLAGFGIRKNIQKFFKGQSQLITHKNVVVVFISLTLVCLGFAISLVSSYILGPLFFSFLFYGTFAYFMVYLKANKPTKIPRKRIEDEHFQSVALKLESLMETEKLYKNPDLNLDTLVERLGKGRHFLSQLLNDNLQKNFFQYVNEYRVQEACGMLSKKQALSVEAIGYEVGFRSKSAFFAAFKKIKGTTPSKYISEIGTV